MRGDDTPDYRDLHELSRRSFERSSVAVTARDSARHSRFSRISQVRAGDDSALT